MKRSLFTRTAAGLVGACLLLAMSPLQSQAPAGVRTYEDILKAIPQSDFLKLRGSKKEEGAAELSKPLIANELNKDATFAVKVDKVETWAFPQAVTGWRILVDKEKVRMGSTAIDTDLIVYVRQDLADVVNKVKKGQKIQVTGRVSRCDLTAKDSPILHIDVQAASITPVAK
jgi:hypothetical protein